MKRASSFPPAPAPRRSDPIDDQVAGPIDLHVGRRIRELRCEKRIPQFALAEDVGLTYLQLHFHETGQERVGAATLFKLAEALEVEVSAFYAGLSQPKPKSNPYFYWFFWFWFGRHKAAKKQERFLAFLCGEARTP